VSYALNADGTHVNLDMVQQASEIILILYYSLYGAMVFCAFFLLPFAYFYFEEEEDEGSTARRACGALKYTVGFVIVFIVLLVLGIVLKSNDGQQSQDWINDLKGNVTDIENILYFSIGCLSLFGLIGWVTYTAYGLASLPVELCRNSQKGGGCCKKSASLTQSQEDEKSLRLLEEDRRSLAACYDEGESVSRWTRDDRQKYNALKREERKIREKQRNVRGGYVAPGGRGLQQEISEEYDCFSRFWDLCAPFRIVFGIISFAASLLIVVSLLMSTIDKFMHSECKFDCGMCAHV
jgi:LMBR1 domain-containing protein 1